MCRNVTDVVFQNCQGISKIDFFYLTTIEAAQKGWRRFDHGWMLLSRQSTSLIHKQHNSTRPASPIYNLRNTYSERKYTPNIKKFHALPTCSVLATMSHNTKMCHEISQHKKNVSLFQSLQLLWQDFDKRLQSNISVITLVRNWTQVPV